jgi:Asp-tRNA(Asn)/Glu-tRNA(Gln) amidotransferase A subunit family amidase
MARTVEDAVRILEVIAGYDPADPITKHCIDKNTEDYTRFLDIEGLKGARIGVFRFYTDKPTADPQITQLLEKAVQDMKAEGAEIVDPFVIPQFEEMTKNLWCDMFRHDINRYLASLEENAPFKNLTEIVNTGLYSTYIEKRLQRALQVSEKETAICRDLYTEPRNITFREAVLASMDRHGLDAFVFPTWSNPPRKIGDLKSPAGDNSQQISPHTGLPAITVPMGFTHEHLPAGLQIVGRLFGEPDLIKIAYSYEQATKHRLPPEGFPPLR